MEAIGIDPLTREVLPNGPFSNWLAARGIDTGGNDSSSSDCGTLRAEIATLKHELAAVKASVPTYRGVWDANDCYSANDLCTWDGSLWYALEDTARKPGSGANSGWRLAVKRGAVRK
jgi:hypothetical protein